MRPFLLPQTSQSCIQDLLARTSPRPSRASWQRRRRPTAWPSPWTAYPRPRSAAPCCSSCRELGSNRLGNILRVKTNCFTVLCNKALQLQGYDVEGEGDFVAIFLVNNTQLVGSSVSAFY